VTKAFFPILWKFVLSKCGFEYSGAMLVEISFKNLAEIPSGQKLYEDLILVEDDKHHQFRSE